jgi:hypothetical protein
VVVGDSCLVPGADGKPMTRYTSDRVPETLGRGGLLIHPEVDGVTYDKGGIAGLSSYVPGEHLLTWELGNWAMLQEMIEWALSHPDENEEIREAAVKHVADLHTYTKRMESIFR